MQTGGGLRCLHAKVRLLTIRLVCQKKQYRMYASPSNHKIPTPLPCKHPLPAWFLKLNHAQPTPHVPPREEIMRRTEKERQREETGGVCRATGHRSSVCKQHGVLHLTLLGYFCQSAALIKTTSQGSRWACRRREGG